MWARLVLVASLAIGACHYEHSRPRNLVLISMDTLRADHLSAYGYTFNTSPNIDVLAARGVRFTNASSTSAWTSPAHASLFTSRYPAQLGLRRYTGDKHAKALGQNETTLAELLADLGYETRAYTGGGFVGGAMGFAQGFQRYEEGSELAEYAQKVIEFLGQEHDAPFFLFVHFYDCHRPYDPPEPYRDMFRGDYKGRYPVKRVCLGAPPPKNEAERRFIMSRYDGEIRAADEVVGDILSALEDNHLWDDTLVVFTSDHGDEFYEHGGCDHTHSLYQELVHVPLIFAGPGVPRGRTVSGLASLVDVAPTILSLLGKQRPPRMIGEDLGALWRGVTSVRDVVFFETANKKVDLVGARNRRHKLIATRGGPLLGLFDLDHDAGETSNRLDDKAHADARAELSAKLAAYEQATTGVAEAGEQTLPSEVSEALRALGYVE